MEANISQLERVAPGANRPFSMMAPSTLPLSPNLFQVWKQPYLMNRFENGESSSEAKAHFQPLDPKTTNTNTNTNTNTTTANTTTTTDTNTSTNTSTTSTTTPTTPTTPSPAVEAIKDNGKKPQEDFDSDDGKIVTVKTEKEEKDDTPIGAPLQIRVGRNVAPESLDPRKLKRILSNRVSAQKSRLKKLQYVIEMEKKAKTLQAQIAVLSPQVEFFKNQNYFLQMEQSSLKQSISAYAVDKFHKDALIEENKKEVQRLRRLQLKKLEQQQMQLQASMFMNMEGSRSPMDHDQKMVNKPGFNQYELGKRVYSSDSKEESGVEAAEEKIQNQISEAEQKPANVKPSSEVGGNKGVMLPLSETT